MGTEEIIEKAKNLKAAWLETFRPQKLFSAKDVCDILHAQMPAGLDPQKRFSIICTFEGAIMKDCLYVQYERNSDGAARYGMRKGAAAVLSAKQIGDLPCIIVPDVLTALRQLSIPIYDKIRVPATVVTGSIGKTTTKNFLNCVYSRQYRTFCNVTNGNTFEYLAFEIQRFDKKAKLFVQEANESDPFNASNCSLVLHPEIAAITNMDKSHIGELGSEENIMKAIASITDGMDENGIVLLNGDDPNSQRVDFAQKVIKVAIHNKDADCLAGNIVESDDFVEFDVTYAGEKAHLRINVGGVHNVYNAMMAYVAGRLHGIPVKKIAKGLADYHPLGFRQNVYRAGKKTIYADCYNASARSIGSALSVVNRMQKKSGGKKIAVLGDIGEIEGHEDEIYREIGEALSVSDIDVLISYGKDSKRIQKYLNNPKLLAFHAETREQLRSYLLENMGGHDVFLFKASRTMGLEKTIKDVFPTAYFKGMLPVWLEYFRWTMKTL